jgi:putative chitinase
MSGLTLHGSAILELNSRLTQERAALLATVLTDASNIAQLESPRRICNFLGQVAEETGGFTSLIESTAYKDPERLNSLFKNVQGVEHAKRLIAEGPQAIGNVIYAGKLGNGDVASGDGYRFRGRGFLQITGRANYHRIGEMIGMQLEQHPELLGEPSPAAEAAAKYWSVRKINVPADADDVSTVTFLVNGAARLNLTERKAWHDKAKMVFPF